MMEIGWAPAVGLVLIVIVVVFLIIRRGGGGDHDGGGGPGMPGTHEGGVDR